MEIEKKISFGDLTAKLGELKISDPLAANIVDGLSSTMTSLAYQMRKASPQGLRVKKAENMFDIADYSGPDDLVLGIVAASGVVPDVAENSLRIVSRTINDALAQEGASVDLPFGKFQKNRGEVVFRPLTVPLPPDLKI